MFIRRVESREIDSLDWFFQKPCNRYHKAIFDSKATCVVYNPKYYYPFSARLPICLIGIEHLAAPVTSEIQELFYHIENHSYDAVRLLLDELRLTPEIRGDALIKSLNNEDEIIFNLILSSGKIAKKQLGTAIKQVVESGNFEKLKQLLNHEIISKEDRSEAVVLAATFNFTSCLELLLKNGRICEESRSSALIKACENGNLEQVELLLNGGWITPSAHKAAKEISLELGHMSIFHFLEELLTEE
jgi:hypothetical protein